MSKNYVTIDGNEAAAYAAYHLNEVIAIYPITPSSPMGEHADQWAADGKPNIWGTVPQVTEMQSEGGAAGAVHGSLQTGALTTTFTASQGLLLMIPNMYKIAGELTATAFHVSARTLATHALSIFGDHSDVMATRSTGFALLSSNSVQEVMDLALIAQAATLEARVPFLHFFDGFRTSHEVMKIEQLTMEEMKAMIDEDLLKAHRQRALSPDHPIIRGTAQNPDTFFQERETINPYYLACPTIVQNVMDKFAQITGRQYRLFDYVGDPDAEHVIVMMGSGAETAQETVEYLTERGEKVGVLKVRLYRPFSIEHFVKALPESVKTIATLDRTKEPGSIGEPLYLDAVTAVEEFASLAVEEFASLAVEEFASLDANESSRSQFSKSCDTIIGGRYGLSSKDFTPADANESSRSQFSKSCDTIIGGRYGLSSKDFTPAMVKSVFDEMKKDAPKNHFTVGINDDVTHTSLEYDANFSTESPDRTRAVFYGLGSDGTVGANKNSIKIIGEDTDNYAQGYFVYDSRKAGSVTTSHLRFGPDRIQSIYLIDHANFVACHQFSFLERFDVLKSAEDGATFLLNSPYGPDEVWDNLPRTIQEHIINKSMRFFVIDAYKIAKEVGLGVRINTIMQTSFFVLSNVIPKEEAIESIKSFIKKSYGKYGDAVVQMNFAAVDKSLDNLHEVDVPEEATSDFDIRPPVPEEAPEFVQNVTTKMLAGEGDDLPVSAMPIDGTFPTGTTQWEKRNIALEIPVWDADTCIQCGKCVSVCPHAVIRSKVYDPELLDSAPPKFKSASAKWRQFKEMRFTVQISPEDCTGCSTCVQVCPAKNKANPELKAINMAPQLPLRKQEAGNWDFFLQIPEIDRKELNLRTIKDVQLLRPLFEFSGACAGCGETPYVKLLSQLFGDRAMIANATGCSSIYGGNLPTTPWTFNEEGRGPTWSNSLFEDNAEFGLGMRLALDKQLEYAQELLKEMSSTIGDELVQALIDAERSTGLKSGAGEADIQDQRERVKLLKEKLKNVDTPEARSLLNMADVLVKKSVWCLGGDGWAYDIGFGGLDHVLALGRNVNILVLDTEVYSNTGGQMSKATPLGAVAKFAAGGKPMPKKDLAMMLMTYGNIYVARVAIGANDRQTVRAFLEAEAYDGPSLIIAYSHCIAHGYNLVNGLKQQKAAVLSGHWPLIRYNPELLKEGKNPLQLDSKAPSLPLADYIYNENRFKMLLKSKPEEAKQLLKLAQESVSSRWRLYEHWASMTVL